MKKPVITCSLAVCLAAAAAGLYWWTARDGYATDAKTQQDISPSLKPANGPALSAAVQTVIGKGDVDPATRNAALKTLPRDLSHTDLSALLECINGDRPQDCPPAQWHAFVDSIINVLLRQENPVPEFTSSLLRLYRQSPDPVLKDYAVQYLRCRFVEHHGYHQPETDPALREQIIQTLSHAASRTGASYSGTALMALDAVVSSPSSRNDSAVSVAALDAVFVNAATHSATGKHCRISALQVCARRGLAGVLPTARTIAADPKADPNVRISAIAAIGLLGTLREDAALLKRLEQEGVRFSHAAGPALQKIARR
jgi:hypothetical protein